jgi:hypothetical protein
MARLNCKDSIRLYESKPTREANRIMREVFKDPSVRSNFSLKELLIECVGYEEYSHIAKDRRNLITERLQEAAGAVSTSAFLNISGQIIYTTTMAANQHEDFTMTRAIPAISTVFQMGEKIPGITQIVGDSAVVPEGDPYPLAGASEDYIETPVTTKRGQIIPVTREAIIADRTNLLLERCRDVGLAIGITQEEEAVDCLIDENRTTHRYKWRGTSYATFQASTPWDNTTASTALTDWTSINAAEQTLNEIVDPNTAKPILMLAKDIIVTKQNYHTARRIMVATNNRTGAYPTSGSNNLMDAPSTLDSYNVLTSRWLAYRMATDTTWYFGDLARALAYMQIWPTEVVQAPPNSQKEFEQDIVMQSKASRKGEYVVREPRCLTKCTV